MKILHLSDLHLEFGEIALPSTDADVVVLSGDIHIGSKGLDWASNFEVPTIITLGNHEAYSSTPLDELIIECRERANEYQNVYFLENESVLIDGVRFHGATLWTDFTLNGNETLSMHYARNSINDFKKIYFEGRLFTPELAAELHRTSRKWLFSSLEESSEDKNVVVTHHLPTPLAIQTIYKTSPLSPAFASDCSEFSKISNKISVWLYGHNHDCREFIHNGIWYSTNQRGYEGHELVKGFDPNKLIVI